MRASTVLIAAALVVAMGCGGDDGGDEPSRASLIDQLLVDFDRQAAAQCECLVLAGAYATQDACMVDFGAGADWAECAEMLFADGTLEWDPETAHCIVDKGEMTASCMEANECGTLEFYECAINPDEDPCPLGADLINVVLERCPDTGLLSRFDGPGD
jgi:hypothetical protein